MLDILTAQQMHDRENGFIARGLPSLLLMEHAAQAALPVLSQMVEQNCHARVLFVCGHGNNGGDGLALARLWAMQGGQAQTVLTKAPKSADAQANLAYARLAGVPIDLLEENQPIQPQIEPFATRPWDAVVDALLGTGLSGPPQARENALIGFINQFSVPILALDIPSGLCADSGQRLGECAVRASHTVAFDYFKRGHYLRGARAYTGAITVADIGLPKTGKDDPQPDILRAAQPQDLPGLLPPRSLTAHKGDCGRVLLYAGSHGMAGAAGMAAQGCLRAGAGLVRVVCTADVLPIVQQAVPNATCLLVEEAVQSRPDYDVFAVGCGLGRGEAVWENILALYDPAKPSVWDADALNLLAAHPITLSAQAIMTPHPMEAARLLGENRAPNDLIAAAKALHQRYQATVVLKNDCSVLFDGRRLAINTTGSSALAKGGSGDALCGIMAGILAQQRLHGFDPFTAAQAACLWMGMAAQQAEQQFGPRWPLAEDIFACMGAVARQA